MIRAAALLIFAACASPPKPAPQPPAPSQPQTEPAATEPAGFPSVDAAFSAIKKAVEGGRLDALAELCGPDGVPFIYAPEGSPRPAVQLTRERLAELHRDHATLLDSGFDPDGIYYLLGAFYEEQGREVLDADLGSSTMKIFACSQCEMSLELESRGAGWQLKRIYVEDFEP